ncbi:hypothetical protein ACU60U_19450 [Klebsiella aerogenes]
MLKLFKWQNLEKVTMMKKILVASLSATLMLSALSVHATSRSDTRQEARKVRQDTRTDGRQTKQDCFVDNNQNNANCRQDKRENRRDGRRDSYDIKW